MNTIQIDSPKMNSTKLSAAEFERQVLAVDAKVAVFDCDGTLWGADAGGGFMNWSIEQGLVSRETSDWIDTRFRAYLAGTVNELQICGQMTQMYAGLREQEMRQAAAQFVAEHIDPHVFEELEALIAKLRANGVVLWAVSSTNKWVIAEGVRRFQIPAERVLAADLRVVNGILTSELLAIPTGGEKVIALIGAEVPRPDVVFGNSIHDLAMLEIARFPFPVNPSPALLDAATQKGWSHFRPRLVEGIITAVGGE